MKNFIQRILDFFKRLFGVKEKEVADYGLKVFDSAGNVTLDTTDKISRLRYFHEAAANESDSVVLADIDGKLTAQFALSKPPTVQLDILPPVVTRSGTTITWTAQTGGDILSAASYIIVFVYT